MVRNYSKIERILFNWNNDYHIFALTALGTISFPAIGLINGIEEAIQSSIENKDAIYYTTTTLKGLGKGITGGVAFYSIMRGLDYLANRGRNGILDSEEFQKIRNSY